MSQYEHLFAAVEACRPQRILEIGTWDGVHAAQMIRQAQRFGAVEYWGFDLFAHCPAFELPKQPPPIAQVRTLLEATGARITLVQGNTRATLPAAELPPMDLIYIDGGHSLETIASDWNCCRKLMHPGTVVMFDDYYPDRTDAGAKPLIDALTENPAYRVEVCQPMVSYPGCNVHMAKVRYAC